MANNKITNSIIQSIVISLKDEICNALSITDCCNLTAVRYLIIPATNSMVLIIRVRADGGDYHDISVSLNYGVGLPIKATFGAVRAMNVEPESNLTLF
ncbi:hypothetical protein ACOME3_004506 [Neoechinorhynchus agilis]